MKHNNEISSKGYYLKIAEKVLYSLNEFHDTKEIFDILNAWIYKESFDIWIDPWYESNRGFALLRLSDGSKFINLLNHLDDQKTVNKMISRITETYHVSIDNVIWYQNDDLQNMNFEEVFISLKDQIDWNEIIEYMCSIEEIITTIKARGFEILEYENQSLMETNNWIKWNILIEMTILWWIMKQDRHQYNYFSYWDIWWLLEYNNEWVISNADLIIKWVNGIKSNDNITWKKILIHVLERLQASIVTNSYFAKKYQSETNEYQDHLNVLSYCIEEKSKILSS